MKNTLLNGKVALVTGAGSGIGRSVALILAQNGAKLVLAGRRQTALEETAALLREIGTDVLVIQTDVTDENAVIALLEKTMDHFSVLDIAVNCAGIFKAGSLDTQSEADFRAVFETNTIGAWLCMKHEIKAMKPQNNGVIVNICSNLGYHVTLPGVGVYGASKAALAVLTRTAALEAIDHGIRINAISPGPFDTSMSLLPGENADARHQRMESSNPSKRVGQMAEIGSAVLWVCTEATYMVGQDLVLDGGVSA